MWSGLKTKKKLRVLERKRESESKLNFVIQSDILFQRSLLTTLLFSLRPERHTCCPG